MLASRRRTLGRNELVVFLKRIISSFVLHYILVLQAVLFYYGAPILALCAKIGAQKIVKYHAAAGK
jgi:hypothetical protein